MNKTRVVPVAAALMAVALGVNLRAAETMIPLSFSTQMMDRSVSPAVDFYRYANGGWLKATEMPSDKARWGALDALGENNWQRIHTILDDAAAHPGKAGTNRQRIGDFYASAIDEAAIEAAGMKPLEPELARIAAIKNLQDLSLYVADAHIHNGTALFGIQPYADQKNNEVVLLTAGQGGLSLPTRDYYFDEKYAKFLPELKKHIAAMFALAGTPADEAEKNADAVLALETELAKVSKTVAELRDPLANYNKMSVDEAAALIPEFDFKAYLAACGVPASETSLSVGQPKFFEGLNRLLKEKPLDDWKIYLRWHAITDSAGFLSSAFDRENFRFYGTVLNGTPAQEPRWQRAAKVLDANVGFAVGELYVAKYFPPEVRGKLEAMIQNMRDVLHDRIVGLDWMTEPTKKKALEKLGTFRVVVGYPEKWRGCRSRAGATTRMCGTPRHSSRAARWRSLDIRSTRLSGSARRSR